MLAPHPSETLARIESYLKTHAPNHHARIIISPLDSRRLLETLTLRRG
jgi:hypothetical protein